MDRATPPKRSLFSCVIVILFGLVLICRPNLLLRHIPVEYQVAHLNLWVEAYRALGVVCLWLGGLFIVHRYQRRP